MAVAGFTPIQLYRSATASTVAAGTSLAAGELFINTTDEKLYFKNTSGTVKLLAYSGSTGATVSSVNASGGTTGLTFSGGPITTSGTLTLSGTLAVANGGTGVTTSTGSGNVVLSTSPTLVTPALGTPSAAVLTNATGLPLSTGVTGTLAVANGGTGLATLTSNYLYKGAGTSALAQSLVYDNGTNVGIGTSSPGYLLTVNGSSQLAGTTFIGTSITDTSAYIGRSSNNLIAQTYSGYAIQLLASGYLSLGAGGSEAARLTSAGYLGIGTSSPLTTLHVNVASSTPNYALIGNLSNGIGVGVQSDGSPTIFNYAGKGIIFAGNYNTTLTEYARFNSSGYLGIGTSSPGVTLDVAGSITARSGTVTADLYTNYGTNLTFNSGGSLPMLFQINASEKMRLDTSGNLGLGVTPSVGYGKEFTLSADTTSGVGGLGVRNLATANNIVYLANNAKNTGAFTDSYWTTAAATKYAQNAGAHYWYTAPSGTAGTAISFTQAMTLDASGNLLVGTTSNPLTAKLYVYSAGQAAVFQRSTAGGCASFQNGSDAGYGIAFLNVAGSGAGSIYWNATTTTYATSSDQRLKHDIVDAPSASSLIDAIKVRSFKWNADDSEQRYGMIAQELLEVAPEAVSQPADPDEMMGVDYSKLVPMLVKELQQLRARVAELEGK